MRGTQVEKQQEDEAHAADEAHEAPAVEWGGADAGADTSFGATGTEWEAGAATSWDAAGEGETWGQTAATTWTE